MDEIQRIIFEAEGAQKVRDLTVALKDEEQALARLVQDLRDGVIAQQQFAAAAGPVARDVGILRDAIREAEREMKGGGLSIKGLTAASTELSWALQDLAQGGFGAILNNIPGILAKLGGPAGLTAAISAGAVAAWAFGPALLQMGKSLVEGSNEVPKATEKYEVLNEQLEEGRKRIAEYRKQSSLTDAQLKDYNATIEQTARLERELADAKRQRAEAERLAEIRSPQDEAAAAGRAADLKAALGGRQMGLVDEATRARENADPAVAAAFERVRRVLSDQRAAIDAGVMKADGKDRFGFDHAAAEKEARKALDDLRGSIRAGATHDVSEAMTKGDLPAMRRLLGQIPADSRFRGALESALPETLEAFDKEQADFDAGNEQWSERKRQRREEAADWERMRRGALAENARAEAGMAAQDEGLERLDKKREKEAEEARREDEKRWGPFRRQEAREGAAEDLEAWERTWNGGYAGDEGAAAVGAEVVVRKAMRGAAAPAEVDRALSQAEEAAASIEDAGGWGSDAHMRITRLAQELNMIKVRQNAQRMQQQQAPQMGVNVQFPFFMGN